MDRVDNPAKDGDAASNPAENSLPDYNGRTKGFARRSFPIVVAGP